MKFKFIILSGILLLSLSFFSSCEEDDCQLVDDKTELKPCDTTGIDTGIELDTIWQKSLTINSVSSVHFSDKYFFVNNDYTEYEFYSIEDGSKIREVNENTVPEFDGYHFKVKGDYLFGYTIIKGSSKIYVYRYNIATGDLKRTDSLDWSRTLAYEEDYFYYAKDDVVVKTDYDLTFRDTIYKFDDKFSYGIEMEIYEYPNPINKKYLIMAYGLKDNAIKKFALIDLETKKIKIKLPVGIGEINDMSINEGLVNISKRDMIFSFDLKNFEYFGFHANYYNTAKIYSISYRQTKERNNFPVVLFDKPGQFSAYDMHYGKTLWSCDKEYEDNGLNSLYPVDLYDEYGNIYTYMTYRRGVSDMGLLDPYTGIIKAKFPKAGYLNVSSVFDKNNILFWNHSGIVKVKIVKK